eukprot:gene27084-32723_t
MAPLRPYELTKSGSFNNPFVKALYSNRKHWKKFLENKERGIRPASMLRDLKVAIGYIDEAIRIAHANSVLIHESREDKFIPLMWKHWIAHKAWTMGSLALIKAEIESIKSVWAPLVGEKETDVSRDTRLLLEALMEQVRHSYDTIATLQFFCTDREWNEAEKVMYRMDITELQHIIDVVERNARESVADRLANQLRVVLSKLFTYKSAQIEYSETRSDQLVRAFRLLKRRQYYGEHMEEIEQRMYELTYLDPHSTFNHILDQKVEESIKMCKEFEEMDAISQACSNLKEAARNAVAEARRNLQNLLANSAKNLLTCLWTACKAIAWPVVAPVLGIKDAFCDTSTLNDYNKGIKTVFMENPWTVSLMVIGLLGGIAAGGYYLLPGVVSAIAIGHGVFMGTLLIGGGAGFIAGYYTEHRHALLAVQAKEEEEKKAIENADEMLKNMQVLVAERSAEFHLFTENRHQEEKEFADEISAVFAKRVAKASQSHGNNGGNGLPPAAPAEEGVGSRRQLLPPPTSAQLPPSSPSAEPRLDSPSNPKLSDPDSANVDKPLTEEDVNALEAEMCRQVRALEERLQQMTAESERTELSASQLDAFFRQMHDDWDYV